MKTFEIDAYAVISNTEPNEGRGAEVVVAYFTRQQDAERLAHGKHARMMGGDKVERRQVSLRIFESFEEYMGRQKKTRGPEC